MPSFTSVNPVVVGNPTEKSDYDAAFDNTSVLRTGGVAIASQAALDFVYASSASQLARLAKGAAFNYPRLNSGANAWEMASVGQELAYSTATGVATLTLSGLDLNAYFLYDIYFETTLLSAADFLFIRFNGDAGADYSNASIGNDSANAGPLQFGNEGSTAISICQNLSYKSWAGRIQLELASDGRPSVEFAVRGQFKTAGTGPNLLSINGAGFKNWTTNVTSLVFTVNGGATANWRAWVYRRNQS